MRWPFRRKKDDDEWRMPPAAELEVGEWEGGVYTTASASSVALYPWWNDDKEEDKQ